MGGESVYRKTDKGRNEVATRANRLGLRERTMLIMVDDKTTRAGLLAKNAHPTTEGILNTLLADGYIEVVPGTEPAAAIPAAAGSPPPTATAESPSPTLPDVEVSLTSASRFACRTLVAVLGPSADDLTVMIEKAKDRESLVAALEKCRQIIQSLAGKKKSEDFWFSVSARLPKA